MTEVLMLLVGLAVPAVVILAPFVLRALERRYFWQSIVATAEKGHPIPIEIAQAFLQGRRQSPAISMAQRDIRRGAVLSAIALGIALVGLCIYIAGAGDPDVIAPAMGVTALAAIPGCIGIAYIVLGWLANRAEARSATDIVNQ